MRALLLLSSLACSFAPRPEAAEGGPPSPGAGAKKAEVVSPAAVAPPACPWYATEAIAQAAFQVAGAVDARGCTFEGVEAKGTEMRLRWSQGRSDAVLVLVPAACHTQQEALPSGWAMRSEGSWDRCPGLLEPLVTALRSGSLPGPEPGTQDPAGSPP